MGDELEERYCDGMKDEGKCIWVKRERDMR